MARKSIELPRASADAGHRRRFNELLRRAKAQAATIRGVNSSVSCDQRKRFVEASRELGFDEGEAAFDHKLKRIATTSAIPRSQRRERNTMKRVK